MRKMNLSSFAPRRYKPKHMGTFSGLVYNPIRKRISKHVYESPGRSYTHASDLSSTTGYSEPQEALPRDDKHASRPRILRAPP
jgi:hypothetical protein